MAKLGFESREVRVNYYYSLEFIRGLAAISVVLNHYRFFLFRSATQDLYITTEVASKLPLHRFLSPFYDQGFFAVQVFWILSGFVMVNKYSGNFSLKVFFQNRFARLYPIYLVTLFYLLILQILSKEILGHFEIYLFNDTRHFILNLLFIPNIGLERGFSYNAPAWSVTIEIYAYISLAIILKLFSKIEVKVTIFMIILSIFFQNFTSGDLQLVLSAIYFFFFGALTYCIVSSGSRTVVYLSVTTLATVHLVVTLLFDKPSTREPLFLQIHLQSYVFLISALLILLTRNESLFILTPVKKIGSWLGSISYSAYLIHIPLMVTIIFLGQFFGHNLDQIMMTNWFFITYLVFILGISRAAFLFFERPLRERLRSP